MRIAAVDQRIARLETREEFGDRRVHRAGRNHQPDRAWRRELAHQLGKARSTLHALRGELGDRLRRSIEDDAIVAAGVQASHHVRAHAPESDHSELHF
jgi:hypothetical protein